MAVFIRKILFPILLFTVLFIIILHLWNDSEVTNINYTLKAYKNTVALYKGEKIIEVYSDIVLNTLPEKDIRTFKTGLSFSSPSEAQNYLEDFE